MGTMTKRIKIASDIAGTHQAFRGPIQVASILSFVDRPDLIGEFEILFVEYDKQGQITSVYGCEQYGELDKMAVTKVEPGESNLDEYGREGGELDDQYTVP